MRWLEYGNEMRQFSVQIDVYVGYTVFSMYNVNTGNVFYKLTQWEKLLNGWCNHEIKTFEFFEEIKEELRELINIEFISGDGEYNYEYRQYSYDKWILPIFRQKRLDELI